MSIDNIQDLLTALGAVLGAAALLLRYLDRRRVRAEVEKVRADADKIRVEAEKIKADAAGQLTGTALELVESLRTDLNTLKTELAILKKSDDEKGRLIDELLHKIEAQDREIAILNSGVEQLVKQVEAFGEKPVFKPARREKHGS